MPATPHMPENGGSHCRVELAAALRFKIPDHFSLAPRLLVGALAEQRIQHIDSADEAGIRVDIRPGDAGRITAPIPTLMVLGSNEGGMAHDRQARAAQQAAPDGGMGFHHHPFRIIELAGFVEHEVGDGDLADIVQGAAR